MQITIAALSAVLLGVLLLPISSLLTPNQSINGGIASYLTSPPPLQTQIVTAILWIGFAALISISVIGIILLVNYTGKKLRK